VVLHTVRVRTVRHLLWLRLEDERRQRELQEAGLTVREELEARVQERTAELVAANAALRAENSERRRAEAALRESEEQYRDLVENINDVIYSQDEQGRVTYVSPIVEPLSGYHPTEIVGHSFTEFIHPDDLPSILASVQRTLAGQLEPSEFRVVTKTGAVRWAHSSSRPIVREERVVGLRGVIADITDRKRAETHTQALLAIADDISGTLDLHELLERVQRRTAEVLPCEIVATFYWQPQSKTFRLISQYGLPVILLPHAEVLAFPPDEPFGGRVASGHTVVMNEITAQSPFLADVLSHFGITALVAVPLRVQGRHLGALVACTTRTGQRFDANQVELCNGIARQLAVGIEATELYRRQQEEAEDAAVLARVGQEMIASLNTPSVLAHFCQLTVEALAGSCGCTFLWQPEYEAYTVVARWGFSQEHQALLDVFRLPEKTVVDLVSLLHSDEVAGMYGPVFPTLIPKDLLMRFGLETAIFLRLQRGQDFLGFQVCGYKEQTEFTARHYRIARGIAQTAALALVNIELLDELKRANRIKEDFVGTMSHELRTPLNVIMGYTQLMAEETFGSLTAEQADVLERISKNTTDLLDLINATLDLSRLQNQQRLSLTVQEIRGAELLAELESEMRQLQRKPSVGLQWQIMPTLPSLYTDKVKLKMVLKNLITNALKFTDAGLITVSARPQQGGVEFGVTDTGIGIPREALSIIFEPFRQVDGSSTRRHGGVGLGLYIVRQLVELLGGTVTVESEVGSGSTFRVWIPAGTHDGEREKTGNGLLPAESPETGV
jgi:PAS domain S-box-containing protein